MNTLFVDACVNRGTSRTERLAQHLLKRIGGADQTVVLEDLDLRPHDARSLRWCRELAEEGDFGGPEFVLARQFKQADTVVIASPFWESSYNGLTKLYLEHVSQLGLTFRYDETGRPVGMTSVRRLYYVTTRGGTCPDDSDFGWLNIRAVAAMFGVQDVRILSASGLDIIGNDVEKIISDAESRADELIRN